MPKSGCVCLNFSATGQHGFHRAGIGAAGREPVIVGGGRRADEAERRSADKGDAKSAPHAEPGDHELSSGRCSRPFRVLLTRVSIWLLARAPNWMLQPTSRCSYVLAIEKAISCQTESVHSQVMTKKPTSTDVATLAQVSRSAVSLVLTGRANAARLSSDTVERVLRAAETLHYRPNASGRSLVLGKTDTIGLIIRDLDLLDVGSGAVAAAQRHRASLPRRRLPGAGPRRARGNGEGDPFGELMDAGRHRRHDRRKRRLCRPIAQAA